jgi:hypothetical protein
VVLLQGDAPYPRPDLWHVCAARLRGCDAQPTRTHNRDGGGRRPRCPAPAICGLVEAGEVVCFEWRVELPLTLLVLQLYTMAMDVHARFRTEAHDDVVARFNER